VAPAPGKPTFSAPRDGPSLSNEREGDPHGSRDSPVTKRPTRATTGGRAYLDSAETGTRTAAADRRAPAALCPPTPWKQRGTPPRRGGRRAEPIPKTERNAPYPCGSGKKFKRCCAGSSSRIPEAFGHPTDASQFRESSLRALSTPPRSSTVCWARASAKGAGREAPDQPPSASLSHARMKRHSRSIVVSDRPRISAVSPPGTTLY